jgi:hypothetical protein
MVRNRQRSESRHFRMPSDLDSKNLTVQPATTPSVASRPQGWFKVGAIAAASAIAGGLAAAWFYRKTLTQLQQASSEELDPAFRKPADEFEEQD